MSLREAYELIRDESRWCQRAQAVNADGWPVPPRRPEAVRWCASGALIRAHISGDEQMALWRATDALFPEVGVGISPAIVAVNDTLGHAAVMQIFEKALVEVEGSL